MEFKQGQRVHVEFDGTVVDSSDRFWLFVKADTKPGFRHQIWRDRAEQVVTLAASVSWPPQVGDIWEAHGNEYGVRKSRVYPGRHIVLSFDDNTSQPDAFYDSGLTPTFDEFKALNPTLIRRRGE